MIHRTLLLAVLLAPCTVSATETYPHTSHFGVPFSKDESWYRQCMRVAAAGVPARGGQKCDASDMYYLKRGQAVTSDAEWATVRSCAIASGDNAVLAMLYANGYGVKRDKDVALYYACGMDNVAKAEMEARVEHLTSSEAARKPFDQCDDITSGFMGAICANVAETSSDRIRDARLRRMAEKLSPASRKAFDKLHVAAERFVTQAAFEVDYQGTGAPEFVIEYQAKLRELFMQAALDLSSGKIPAATQSQYEIGDVFLNEAYGSLMNSSPRQVDWPDRIGLSTVSKKELRSSERLWLAYRDAFAAFAATLPDGVAPLSVRTRLTNQRVEQLRAIAQYL